MPVYSVKKQLFMFGFVVLGIASFILTLYGASGSSAVVLIANYQSCPSPPLTGPNIPPGYIPCDANWKYTHALLAVTNWNLFSCHGSETWAPTIIIYIDKTTSDYRPPCTTVYYYSVAGILGMVAEGGLYAYEVRFRYAKEKVWSFVGAGKWDRPTAYGNAFFDFWIIVKMTLYSPEVFGSLETPAQIAAAQGIKDGTLHGVLVDFVSNDERRGRAFCVFPWNPNEAMNYGEPHVVQLGLFPRHVSGTALVTGIFIGNSTKPPISEKEFKKWGLGKEIPYWQKTKLLSMFGKNQDSEIISWYMMDDCDARRRDVQEAVYRNERAKDRLITVDTLKEGKIGAFIAYHDSLPTIQQLEVQREWNNMLEDRLEQIEDKAIAIGKITKPGEKNKDGIKWPALTRTDKILIAIAALVLGGVVFYELLLPAILHAIISQDLAQINNLIQSAPPAAKPSLIQAQQDLSKAARDLSTNGAGAINEAEAAINEATKAISNIVGTAGQTNLNSTSIINSNTSSSTSVVQPPAP